MSTTQSHLDAKLKRTVFFILWLVACLTISAVYIGPVLWMLLTAFKPLPEIRAWPPQLLPQNWTIENFERAWVAMYWPRLFFNSALLATTITVLNLTVSSLATFAFACLRFPYKNIVFMLVLATMIVPEQVDLIPRFLMMNQWGLVNTYVPLILLAAVHAFNIFLYRQFFGAHPLIL